MADLPQYISKSIPNPPANRAPWYKNTAPSYAGVFLWVVFYQQLAKGTLEHAGPLFCLGSLAVAALLSYGLYYYVPAMLGMKTGYPLYVVGSSTFGTAGGYIMPGLLMGLLQIGWFAVGTFFSTSYILQGVHANAAPRTVTFAIVAVLWGLTMGYIGVKGIQYVARVSLLLNLIPALMVLVVFFKTAGGISSYKPAQPDASLTFVLLLQAVIGFFATAGAAGADFGMNSRDARDVKWGGLVGIVLAILYAGGLPLLSVAGAHGTNPNLPFEYDKIIGSVGGFLASAMFLLFAVASIVPACFCAFIAGNSFATMLPGVKRMSSTMIGVVIAIILAVTGYAQNLSAVFGIVGASFGPICGAMVADYLLSGRKWAGPRKGINWAGYSAWALGFVVGLLPYRWAQPAVVYSFFTGLIVYAVVAKMGGEPETVEVREPVPMSPRSRHGRATATPE